MHHVVGLRSDLRHCFIGTLIKQNHYLKKFRI